MIRRLIATTVLLALAVVLVSPCSDLDDAVHHHQHHQHVGLSANGAEAPTASLHESEPSIEPAVMGAITDSSVSALRC